jgi:hypothetical protein
VALRDDPQALALRGTRWRSSATSRGRGCCCGGRGALRCRHGKSPAEIIDEYGPFPGVDRVHGVTYDGHHLFQLAEDRTQKIDPETGHVVAAIPAPGAGADSGLAWAEGTLWVGQYRDRRIQQIDPQTGAILRTLESNRFVTGVTWVEGELWHGTWEAGESELRRLHPQSGEVLDAVAMPAGAGISGREFDGGERFFCGGGASGTVRAVRRPRRGRVSAAP